MMELKVLSKVLQAASRRGVSINFYPVPNQLNFLVSALSCLEKFQELLHFKGKENLSENSANSIMIKPRPCLVNAYI